MTSSSPTLAPSLSDSLLASSRHIQGVLSGKSLTECLSFTPDTLRASSQAISFYALRRLGFARQLRQIMVPRKPQSAWLEALLLVSLVLVDSAAQAQDDPDAFIDRPDVPVYTVHTVVDQVVNAAGSQPELRAYKALLNGTLRRFLREREALLGLLWSRRKRNGIIPSGGYVV